MEPDLILLILYMCIAGSLIGIVSGLIPGIHVNTLAALIVIFQDSISSALSSFIPIDYVPAMMVCYIMSAAVMHSAVDFIPSTFMGLPDADSALNVLPAHRLLFEGKGMVAVRSAAIGSLVGAFTSIVLAIPMYYLLSTWLGEYMDSITVGVLLLVLILMIIKEDGRNRAIGTALIIVSGVIGIISMSGMIPSIGFLGFDSGLMLPLLSGLFGMPAIIMFQGSSSIPPQSDENRRPVGLLPGIKGVLTGSLTGWFPGITSTSGATIAGYIFGEEDSKGFISMTSSIGTASTMFAFITFCISGNERSGTMTAVSNIIENASITPGSELFTIVMITLAITSVFAYFVTISAGQIFSKVISAIDINRMNLMIIAFTVVLTYLMTGYWGIILLLLCTAIGIIPVITDTNRIHLTGCLIVPVILFTTGIL